VLENEATWGAGMEERLGDSNKYTKELDDTGTKKCRGEGAGRGSSVTGAAESLCLVLAGEGGGGAANRGQERRKSGAGSSGEEDFW